MNWSQVWVERRINCHCGQIKYWWSREASLVKESQEIHCGGGGRYDWHTIPLIGRAILIPASNWLLRSHLPECDLTHNQDRRLLHYSLPLRRIISIRSIVHYTLLHNLGHKDTVMQALDIIYSTSLSLLVAACWMLDSSYHVNMKIFKSRIMANCEQIFSDLFDKTWPLTSPRIMSCLKRESIKKQNIFMFFYLFQSLFLEQV